MPARIRVMVALAAAALPAGPLLALDPARASSQYVVTRWGADDLPSNAVHVILQTRDGYLWLGTSAGLARFDGARLVLLNGRNYPDFGDGGVTSLSEGRDGALYCGTTSGVVLRYKDGVVTRLTVPSAGGTVHSLVAARDGSLWVAPFGRPVHRWLEGRAITLGNQLNAIGPLALAEDAQGGVWVGTRRDGLAQVEGGRVTRYDDVRDSLQALHFDRKGVLWAGTPHGLARLRGGNLERLFTKRDGLTHDNVTAVLEDHDGNLWVGTAGGGLNRWRQGRFDRLTTVEGLSDDDVRCLFEDAEGNLWVGTADGLNRISEGRFVTYGRLEGLPDPSVRSVLGGRDGSVWIGTTSHGVSRLRDGVLAHVRLPSGVGPEAVLVLYESRDKSLWIGLDNGGLFHVKDGKVAERTPLDVRPSTKIPVIFEDEKGLVLWVTGRGLARLRGRTLEAFAPDVGLGYPHGAYHDRQGRLWLYGSRGLARLNGDGTRRVFTPREGLPHERVRGVVEDPLGGLWAATIGGLAYVKDDVVRKVTVQEGLPESYLRLVLDDGLGHLWIASMGHVFRLDKREVFDLFAGKVARVSPVSFDSSDGLRTSETLLSNSPGFRDGQGRLWFATAKGVSVVDPAQVPVDEPAPPVIVEALGVDGRAGRPGAEFPPGRGHLRIEYTALRFAAASKMRFRYRLDGFDDGWVEAGDRRLASYNNLGPGRYRFAVMASNRDGRWSGPETSLSFTIRPPFFQTPLFYLGCAVALLALGGGAYRFHVGQMRSRFAAIIAERTRIARELHDTLAQGLAGVGIQIDTALRAFGQEPSRAREHIKLARAMVRSSLSEVRRSIWVLRAQTTKRDEGLAATLSENLAQLTADTGIEASLQVTGKPRALTAEVERNLLRIAHEAVTNAVRHAKARTIATDLRFEPSAVSLLVRDDGQGFDPEACLSKRPAAHFGLVGISERARALGGELRLQSRPGEGTEIVCRLPYAERNGGTAGEALEGEIP